MKTFIRTTCICLMLAAAAVSHAATKEWTGSSGNLWTDGSNWLGGSRPSASDTVAFSSNSTANLSTLLGTDFLITGMLIDNPASDITIGGGNTLTIGTGGIAMTPTAGNLTFNSGVALATNQNWTFSGGKSITINKSLTGTAKLTCVRDKINNRSGSLVLSGTNSFNWLAVRGPNQVYLTGNGRTEVNQRIQVNDGGGWDNACLYIQDNHTLIASSLCIQEAYGHNGHVYQSGGKVVVTNSSDAEGSIKIGHWRNDTSTYEMTGGELFITNSGTYGKLTVGVDGIGEFYLGGGTVMVKQLSMDERSSTPGQIFTMTGGVLRVGANGITTAGGGYTINLGSGRLEAWQSWSSNLRMQLTENNNPVVITPDSGMTISLNGQLSGSGTFIKEGAGTLVLGNNSGANFNDFSGNTIVKEGTLKTINDYGQSRIPHDTTLTVTNGSTLFITGLNSLYGSLGSPDVAMYDSTISLEGVHQHLGNLLLNGSVLITDTNANHYNSEDFSLDGTISVSGSGMSIMTINHGIGLTINSSFNVEDSTGSTAPDLIVNGRGRIRNNVNLTKTGGGTMLLNNTNTYSGITDIQGGTLALSTNGAIAQSSAITMATGSVFDVSDNIAGISIATNQSLTGFGSVNGSIIASNGAQIIPGTENSAGTLTFGGNLTLLNNSKIQYNLTNTTTVGSSTNDLLLVGGNLALNSTADIYITPQSQILLTPGTYRLIEYIGTLSGGAANLSLNDVIRATLTLDDSTAGQINLIVAADGGFKNLSWQGGSGGNAWNNGIAMNWLDGASASLFYSGDSVTFDNTGSANSQVIITEDVYPDGISVTASTDYTLSGSGSIRGDTGLTKTGTGSLTTSNANTYAGTTIIGAGTLIAGNNSALGASDSGTVVSNGATLNLNGFDIGDEQVSIAGTGTYNQGAIISDNAASIANIHRIHLTDDAAIGGEERWDMRSGNSCLLNLNGHTLTKLGTGAPILVNTVISNGTIVINDGGIAMEGSSTTTPGVDKILVNTNATLALAGWGGSPQFSATIALNGGTLGSYGNLGYDNLTPNISMPVTITNTCYFNPADDSINITGTISGSGFFEQNGNGTVNLTATNTYTGGTLVSAGSLQIGNNTTGGSVIGTITNNSNLYFYRTDAFTLINNIRGTGGIYLRTAAGMTVDTNASIEIDRDFNVGQNQYGKLIVADGGFIQSEILQLGNPGGVSGDIIQNGGTVNVTDTRTAYGLRIGHWPSEISSYTMAGGLLECSNTWVHVGWDGIGIMTQSGGEIHTAALDIDGNRPTGPINNTTNTYTMTGGRIIIGAGGIRGNDHAVINLGGGIVESSAPWSCSKNITLTGNGGNVTFNTPGGDITLSGRLSGPGGLTVDGNNTLTLSATNSFSGAATVNSGNLEVTDNSTLGSSSNITVAAGAALAINSDSTIATNAVLNISGTMTIASGVNNTVSELYLGGQAMVAGTWGAPSSPAAHKNSSRFSGSGIITVLNGPPPSGLHFIVR